MKYFAGELKRALLAVALLSFLLCAIFPLAVWSFGQLFFPEKANGSVLKNGQKIIGSILIGQPFASPTYFHSRPSAVAYSYSGPQSGGSNLGPLSKKLSEQIRLRIHEYRRENGLVNSCPIAADAISASASGLDPHISPANAYAQAARVARARGMKEGQVRRLIQDNMEVRQFGIFGEQRINVLLLNLALDRQIKML
jgi:potassium-transporting ATPase KdpC subunit